MYGRYWLSLFAVVGLVLFTTDRVDGAQPHETHMLTKTFDERSQPAPPVLGTTRNPSGFSEQTANEKRAEQREIQNLSQQTRMADAARDQVNISEWQNGLVAFEALLLAVTIFFTAQAAIAATEGTKAANKAIQQSEHHARIALRPYISVETENFQVIPSSATTIDGPIHVIFSGKFKNSGQMPAEHVRVITDIRAVDWPPRSDQLLVRGEPDCLSTQGIGRESEHTYRFQKPIVVDGSKLKTGSHRIVLTGRISYEDAWGQIHKTEFVGSILSIADMILAWEANQASMLAGGSGTGTPIPAVQFEWYRPDIDIPQSSDTNL